MLRNIDSRVQAALYGAARPVALLIVFGLCSGSGTIFAQFRAESDLGGGDNVQGAVASTVTSTAIGAGAMATGSESTALGRAATASGLGSTGLGRSAVASAVNSTALGVASAASGGRSTALGAASAASGGSSSALGFDSAASGGSSSALGAYSAASGDSSSALGAASVASGIGSTAVGATSVASGIASSTLGATSVASGERSTAVGFATAASFDRSTAIGDLAVTTRADQMMFGNASTTYTAPGITSAASKAAQTGPLEVVTTDAGGNLASNSLTSMGIASQQDVSDNTEGVAMAMALSGVPTVLPLDTNYAISTNWGGFNGENAIAVGGTARLTDNVFLNGGGAIGTNRGNGGGRAGVTIAW